MQRFTTNKRSEVISEKQYDTTENQNLLWLANQMEVAEGMYNEPVSIQIKGNLNQKRLKKSLQYIVEKHEALQVNFVPTSNGLKQVKRDQLNIEMDFYDVSVYPLPEKTQILDTFLESILHKRFDLTSDILYRFQLYRLAIDEYLLHMVFYHIIFDGWSLGLFLQDLEQSYSLHESFETTNYKNIHVYKELLQKHQNYIGTNDYIISEKYWEEKLRDALPWSAFPAKQKGKLVPSYRMDAFQRIINPVFINLVKQYAKKNQVSSYRVWLGIYLILLHQMTNQTDLTVEIPINIRSRDNKEQHVFGYFVNAVPLCIQLATDETFSEFVQKTNSAVQEILVHQNYPLHHLVYNPAQKKEVTNNSLCSTAFNMVKLPSFKLGGLETKLLTHQKRVSNLDMVWRLVQTQEDVVNLEIDFNSSKYDVADIQNLMDRFQCLLQLLLQNSEIPLQNLDFLLPEEKIIYQNVNDTELLLPSYHSIQERFYKQVQRKPEAIAISTGDNKYTYQEINQRSNQVARHLLQSGIQKQERVAIFLERSVESIIAMLGVLKAGGTYVPIDVKYPSERIQYMLQDSQAKVMITNRERQQEVDCYQRHTITIEDVFTSVSGQDIPNQNRVEDAAYMIYTSGSTGNPKGTLLKHEGVLNLVEWRSRTFQITENDIVSQFYSHSFDSSVSEIFSALLTGARLHLLNEEQRFSAQAYCKAISMNRITITDVATAFFNQLATELSDAQLQQLRPLRVLSMGGEAASAASIRNWQLKLKDTVLLVNEYGPTETTVSSLYYPISKQVPNDSTHVPIGKPIANTNIYILNEHLQMCPIGVIGELYIESIGTAIGYHNQPERTAQSFVSHPFSTEPSARLYRTGDLVRLSQEGYVEYMGRRDRQVKIRGYRIELEEIEERLLQHPSIQQAVVMVYQNEKEQPQLLAFYKAIANKNRSTRELQAFLSKSLPDFMIPSSIQCVEDFPLTPSGKIDQKALLAVFQAREIHQDAIVVPPHTHTEKQLQQIWGEVLQKKPESMSTEDDFFAIGGHSLLTVQLINRIEAQLHVKITFKDVYQYRTIQTCSTYIDQLRPIAHKNPIERVPEQPYYPLSNAQQRLWFLYQQHPEYRTYDIPMQVHIQPGIQVTLLKQALEEMVKRHEMFRTNFIEKDGEPMQCVQKEMDLILHEVDIQQIEEKQQEAYRLASIQKIDSTAFHLEQGPLFRTILFTENRDCSWLYINFHHIIMDEWSLQRFLQEVLSIYEEISEQRAIPFTQSAAIRYIDYVAWQKQQLATGAWEHEKQYWKETLQDVPTLALPLDHIRPSVTSHRGDTLSTKLNRNDVSALKKLAQQEQISLYMLLFTAYTHFLQQISGQQDFVVGTPVTGRPHEAFEDIQGFFVNTVAIRVQTDGVSTMEELCAEVTERCLRAFQHQQYPFDQVIQDSNPERGENSNPIFSTMFSYQQEAVQRHLLYQYQIYPVQTNVSKFDVSLACEERDDEIRFHFEYASDLFERETISRFMQQFVHTVQVMIHHFKASFSEIELLAENDRMLYQQLNETALVLPPYQSIQERFCDQVQRRSEAIAISTEHNRYTYQEIHQRSNQVAHRLLQLGIQKQERVAIFLERSVESIIAMLGVLKAGGTYVPIDVKYPPERIQYILEDSQATVLITKVDFFAHPPKKGNKTKYTNFTSTYAF